jgi:hypothetical protein
MSKSEILDEESEKINYLKEARKLYKIFKESKALDTGWLAARFKENGDELVGASLIYKEAAKIAKKQKNYFSAQNLYECAFKCMDKIGLLPEKEICDEYILITEEIIKEFLKTGEIGDKIDAATNCIKIGYIDKAKELSRNRIEEIEEIEESLEGINFCENPVAFYKASNYFEQSLYKLN